MSFAQQPPFGPGSAFAAFPTSTTSRPSRRAPSSDDKQHHDSHQPPSHGAWEGDSREREPSGGSDAHPRSFSSILSPGLPTNGEHDDRGAGGGGTERPFVYSRDFLLSLYDDEKATSRRPIELAHHDVATRTKPAKPWALKDGWRDGEKEVSLPCPRVARAPHAPGFFCDGVRELESPDCVMELTDDYLRTLMVVAAQSEPLQGPSSLDLFFRAARSSSNPDHPHASQTIPADALYLPPPSSCSRLRSIPSRRARRGTARPPCSRLRRPSGPSRRRSTSARSRLSRVRPRASTSARASLPSWASWAASSAASASSLPAPARRVLRLRPRPSRSAGVRARRARRRSGRVVGGAVGPLLTARTMPCVFPFRRLILVHVEGHGS